MPIIQPDYSGSGKRAEDRNDLRLKVHSHKHKRDFEFVVRRNSVEVQCLNPVKHKRGQDTTASTKYNDWRNALSEEEKIRAISLILDEYRKHSIGDEHGYRGAVLGVAENGDMFLGANTATEQITSPYMKECAEQNMVSAASDVVAYRQVRLKGWDNFDKPKAPKFAELYMMGGVDQTRVPVSCPCGKCTDMLAKNMVEGGKVYALPILNQQTFDYLNSAGKPVESVSIGVHRNETLANVRDKVTFKKPTDSPLTPYPVWQTTIEHLNAEREYDLLKTEPEVADMQRKAYAKICAEAKKITGLREEKLAEQHREAMKFGKQKSSLQLFETLVHDLFSATKKLTSKAAELLGVGGMHPVAMAAANAFVGRRSIAELDAASAGGAANIVAINEFMLSEIRHTLADRILSDKDAKGMWIESIRKAVPSIRCVVLQLDDGTFHHAVECSGKYDASLPNAEAAAVVQALPSLGSCGIRDVWVMEMNGEAIKKGILMTSPKEGAERIIKRASSPCVTFHFVPLNAGDLNKQAIESIIKSRSDEKVMPALFKGSRPLGEKGAVPRRAWSEFLSLQAANADKYQ